MTMKPMEENEHTAMPPEMMMNNAGCMKSIKMHPGMMSGDSMMAGHRFAPLPQSRTWPPLAASGVS
jgi:hypothetical protein